MGGSGNDWLVGATGNDSLAGGAGADILFGNAGKDVLTGDSEADTFKFTFASDSRGSTRDVITDFVAGTDRISLVAIDADSTATGKQKFMFIGSTAFDGTAGQLRFQESGGNTFVHADTNGDGAADMSIELTGSKALAATDFVLV
jgi:Ca2+-binding RTX toxin-like protein